MTRTWIDGEPGLGEWLERLRAAPPVPSPGLRLDYVLRPDRWIDLDTLVERTIRALAAGRTLGAVVATKRWGPPSGMALEAVSVESAARAATPGAALLDLVFSSRPRDRAGKADARAAIAASWHDRPVLTGPSWVDVRTSSATSLLNGVEALLDCLEPVLGRDPRGREWQEFFPFDDRIVWLRVVREPGGPALRLRAGRC